jgi:predicted dehydrogenase
MATKLSDADLIIKAAKKVGKILTVFHNARYLSDFLKVKQIINSGKLGRIIMIKMCWSRFGRRWDWQTLKKFGGGTLNNTAPHAIDQALQLFGEKEPDIFCHLERTVTLGDADDHLKIIFRAEGMPMIDLEISNACAYPTDYWNVMGTRGGLRGSASELCWKYFDPANLTKREVETQPTPDRSYNQEEIPWQEESWNASSGEFSGQIGFYLDLYRTINDKSPLTITAESARRVMWVIEECHRMSGI